MDDFVNNMIKHQMDRLLGLTTPEPAATSGTFASPNQHPLDGIMRALKQVQNQPVNKTSYCSWRCFVDLLMASNFTITGGYKTSDITWRFELNGVAEFVVSEAVPIDDKILQFKDDNNWLKQ